MPHHYWIELRIEGKDIDPVEKQRRKLREQKIAEQKKKAKQVRSLTLRVWRLWRKRRSDRKLNDRRRSSKSCRLVRPQTKWCHWTRRRGRQKAIQLKNNLRNNN